MTNKMSVIRSCENSSRLTGVSGSAISQVPYGLRPIMGVQLAAFPRLTFITVAGRPVA